MRWPTPLLLALAVFGFWLHTSFSGAPHVSSSVLFAQQPSEQGDVPKPSWSIGDTWDVETSTQRIQVRESVAARQPARLRWRFKVAGMEEVAGVECYRIDIECLAKGRLRPATTIWCDKDTLFLRQFQTQVANNGQMHVLQESYAVPKGQFAPVVAPINALPIALPAFVPAGSKNLGDFTYTSSPTAAGSKDTGALRFAYTVKQAAGEPSRKSLNEFRKGFAKALDNTRDVTEIKLDGPHQAVVQLWKKDTPWPVFTDNGRTQAWLVSDQD